MKMRLISSILIVAPLGFAQAASGTEEQFTEACLASSNLEPQGFRDIE
jgi:hypothetical protein